MRKLFAVLAFAALSACGSDSSTGPSATVVTGAWSMRSVNGASLPFSYPASQGATATVTSSVLTISPNGTYNEVLNWRVVSGASTTTTTTAEVGTWTATGGAITFHDQTDNVTYQGSVSANTLTEINNGYSFVYGR